VLFHFQKIQEHSSLFFPPSVTSLKRFNDNGTW
jgi:hypothetical protein